jgi:hypothetical protein
MNAWRKSKAIGSSKGNDRDGTLALANRPGRTAADGSIFAPAAAMTWRVGWWSGTEKKTDSPINPSALHELDSMSTPMSIVGMSEEPPALREASLGNRVVGKTPRRLKLALQLLKRGYPCLTKAGGTCLANAAGICLEDQHHNIGVILAVYGEFEERFALTWPRPTDQVRRELADPNEATESGACGIAILLMDVLTDYHIVHRSWVGTGFDYWLGKKKDVLCQSAARLEVSGIRTGGESAIQKRVNQKVKQTKRSDELKIPAYVVVVEFGSPVAFVVSR